MNIKRGRIVPEKTSRALLLENVIAEVVLVSNKGGKKELVFYRVEEKDLSESVSNYLLAEGIDRRKKFAKDTESNAADECKHFDPLIPGKKKYFSCDYCKLSRDCLKYRASRRKTNEEVAT